jgi:arabinofuranosyltransferase
MVDPGSELRTLRIATIVVGVAACAWAWHNRFLQDDAMISFRYAEHLANGHGLVWNIGNRIEGFTNFLWTILIAAGIWCGGDPIAVSFGLGFGCFAGCLYVSARLAHTLVSRAGDDSDDTRRRAHYAALAVVLLLGTNFSFSSYATSGLETCSQAFLFTLIFFIAMRAEEHGWTLRRLVSLSVVVALAIWTRFDSAIIVASITPIALSRTLKPRNPELDNGGRAIRFVALAAPAAVLIGLLLVFKLVYFGTILPNTFHVKVDDDLASSLSIGWKYVFGFVTTYALYVPICSVLAYAVIRRSIPVAVGLGAIVLWMAYMVRVGGDFMEFRMMLPILPILYAYFAACVVALPRWVFAALVAICVIASLAFLRNANDPYVSGLECTKSSAFLGKWTQLASKVGRKLGDAFQHDSTVLVVTGGAGAIPYYSKLAFIDELGLNDAYVARHGVPYDKCPGHRLIAPAAYVVERRANIVLKLRLERTNEHTWSVPELIGEFFAAPGEGFELPDTAKVIEFPITRSQHVPLLYLFPHPTIESAIESRHWRVYTPVSDAGG